MTSLPSVAVLLLAALASAALVGIVRRVALARGVIDHPTHRGSHDTPTPRGGGLGIVVTLVGAFLAFGEWSARPLVLVGIAGCAAVAGVGWLDDRRGLAVRTRLVVHLLGGAAVGMLAIHAAAPPAVDLALFLWWGFWTVSSINLINFLDGINGLVASQIAIFALSLAAFGIGPAAVGSGGDGALLATVTAGACLGFLPWNFPRARIFLGDVGSGALGYLVPFLALLTMRDHSINIVQAHLPLIPIFGDATVTIFRRWRRGEVLTEAHRSHLYQRLANAGFGHTRVTLLYGAVSLLGAILAHCRGGSLPWLLAAAYAGAVCGLGLVLERRLRSMAQLT